MSHFCVMVCDTLEESVESQLAPFSEQDEEYMEKEIEIYAKDVEAEAQAIVEKALSRWTDESNKPAPDPSQLKYWKETSDKYVQLRDAGKDDEIIKDWNGYDKDEDGNYYSQYNPNAKWDWYEEGGRWAGFFRMKPNHKDDPVINGHFSQTKEEIDKMKKDLRTDRATVKEIDWDRMRADNIKQAEGWWAEYESADDKSVAGWKWDIYKNDTKETYLARKASVAPFAVLIDGEWSERGSMGWFGMVSDEDDKWEEQFDALVAKLIKEHPLMELTIVDCHI